MSLLSPKQAWSIKRSNSRLNIWEGSVRSGKTVGSIYRWIKYIDESPPGDLLLAGKTIDALKRNVINPVIELLGDNASYHPGKREMRIFNKTLFTVGASDERSEGKIRGSTIAGAYGDELTLWPQSFFQMMLSRMSVTGAKFFGSTNPDSPNHWLKRDYIDRKNELDMSLFHFNIDDNPYLPADYVASLKKEYVGLWYKRFIEGRWCLAEGAVYDFFDEKLHTIDYYPDAEYYDVGVDYGTTNPCVFLLFGVNPRLTPKIWCEREYYFDPAKLNRQQTDEEFSADLMNFIAPVRKKLRNIYCDPSAESFQLQIRKDFNKRGFPSYLRDAENDVLNGIRTKASMLKSGDYAINRLECKNYIREFYGYSWDRKKQLLGIDLPMKVGDHCQDAGRYVIHSKYGSSNSYDISKFAD